MRKQALCLAGLLLGAGWSGAQPAPYGGPVAALLGGPPAAAAPATPANYAGPPGAAAGVAPVNYWGGYPNPYAYNYGPAAYGFYPAQPVNGPYGGGYPCLPPGAAQVPMAPVPPEVAADDPGPGKGLTDGWGLGSTCRKEKCWVNAAYGLFFLQRGTVPPLVTVGSALDNPAGALGQPGTSVVFGNNNYNYGTGQGVIAEAGAFLDCDNCVAVDVRGLYMSPQFIRATFASDPAGNPVIARPVFNTLTGMEGRFLTSFPGAETGSTSVEIRSLLYGAESNVSLVARLGGNFEADVLTGFRFLRFDERLTINDAVTPLIPNNLTFLGAGNFINPPNSFTDQDLFQTRNSFYGANVGARFRWRWNWLSLAAFTKVGLGTTEERVHIQGSTTLVTPGGNVTVPGGVLALPSNSGDFKRNVFGVLPETGLTLGVEPIRHVRLTVGYSYLFWNRVARPGLEIDRAVNPGQVPTSTAFGASNASPNPVFTFRDQSFSVNIINLGMELYY